MSYVTTITAAVNNIETCSELKTFLETQVAILTAGIVKLAEQQADVALAVAAAANPTTYTAYMLTKYTEQAAQLAGLVLSLTSDVDGLKNAVMNKAAEFENCSIV